MTKLVTLAVGFMVSCFVTLCVVEQAHAKTWEQAIQDVEALLERYIVEVQRRTGERPSLWQGAMNDDREWTQHMCAILGRRHGLAARIGHLEPPQPSFSAETHDLELHLVSLSNWVAAARGFAEMPAAERSKVWNTECAGRLGIPKGLWLNIPDSTKFKVDGDFLYVYGDITSGFADAVIDAISHNPGIMRVSLGSTGGVVDEAIRAGRFIRQRGLDTQLHGTCMSACPLVFMGGVKRSMFRNSPRFGFHKVSIDGRAIPNDHPTYKSIWDYVAAMTGRNADPFLLAMWSAEPWEMAYLRPWEECATGIATWYQGFNPGECPVPF